MRWIPLRLAGLVAAALAVGFAGCGGSDDSADEKGASAKSGGSATAYFTSFPDALDPAISYTADGWQTLWTVYTPLLTYNHAEGEKGATLIPGLAEAMPEVSADRKTYTLKLREGLVYSDGSPVKAGDFEHAVKRLLTQESGGTVYFQGIVGAEEYLAAGKARADIAGITTDDAAGTIAIELVSPDGQFPFVLASLFAAPVPSDTPFTNQTKTPPPGVGPFMISEVDGSRGFTLKKNPKYTPIDGVPAAKLDTLEVSVVKESARQGQDVLSNKVDYIVDPPGGQLLREIREKEADRFKQFRTLSSHFVFLNHDTPPFDKKEVRQAVNFALDKRALSRLLSGLLEPTCNFLPEGMQGYEKLDPCPYGDPNAAPNVTKAKELIKAAGAEGAKVSVWGNDEPETRETTQYLAEAMKGIGLDASPKIISGEVYYSTIGNAKTKAQAGFASWFSDFPHPATFTTLVDGKSIQPTNSLNLARVDDPVINEALAKAAPDPDLAATAAQYAAVDKRIVDEAHMAPFGQRALTLVTSDRLDFDAIVWNPLFTADFTTFALK